MQISMLICSMANQAKDILVAFGLTEDELKNYGMVLTNFDDYFVKKTKHKARDHCSINEYKQKENP